jgi:hypothetical protein
MLGLLLSILFSFNLSEAGVKHEFHTSLTEMTYNLNTEKFELSIRVFTDDLEKALKASGSKEINEQSISSYLKGKLVLTNGQVTSGINFIGSEAKTDVTYLYLELPMAKTAKNLVFKNQILTEIFPDQSNIVNIQIGTKTNTLLFKKTDREKKLI